MMLITDCLFFSEVNQNTVNRVTKIFDMAHEVIISDAAKK